MRASRLLVVSLLVTLCVAAAAAQSSSDKKPVPSPVPSQNAQASPDLFPSPLHFNAEGSIVPSPPDSQGLRPLTLGQAQPTCYTIRAYRVIRENPDSDVIKPAGYSTCQRSAQFQLRTAVDSRSVAPR